MSIQIKNNLWTVTANSTYVHSCVVWLLEGKYESVPFPIPEVCANCWRLRWNPTLNCLVIVPAYSRLWQCYSRTGTNECCIDLSIVVANIPNEYTSKILGTKTTNWAASCLSHVYPVSPPQCPWINIPNNTWRRIKHNALQAGWKRVPFPMVSVEFFSWHNPSGRTMALGSTQPLTEIRTRNISWR